MARENGNNNDNKTKADQELEEFKEALKQNADANLPAMESSTIYSGIISNNALKDPFFAMQLGFAVLLDKPLAIIIDKDVKIPKHLVKIAGLIEKVEMGNPTDIKRASNSVGMFVKTLADKGEIAPNDISQ